MSEPKSILAIRQTLSDSGPAAAERQLAVIADQEGDDQLAIMVKGLTPGEISQLVSEGDFTKPSVVAHHLSPEQLVGALHRMGGKWGSVQDSDKDTLLPLRDQVRDFFMQGILHAEEAQRVTMLRAILDDNLAHDALVAISLFDSGCPEFLVDRDWGVAQDGTWQELYMMVRDDNVATFEAMSKEVISVCDTEGDDGSDTKRAEKFLRRTLQAMVNKASDLVTPEEKAAQKKKNVFEDY